MFETNWDYQAELAAVNDILASIGESAVNTLEGDGNADVVNARRILQKINRQEQAKGWTFNIDESAELSPDVYSKLIPFMPNYLSIISQGGTPYINRGCYVYDRLTKTDRFDGPITVSLISQMTFSEMPEVFKAFIVTKAAKQFNMRFFGDADVNTELSNDLIGMQQALTEYELDYGAYNVFTDPFIAQAIQR